jgi:hypothetical protein
MDELLMFVFFPSLHESSDYERSTYLSKHDQQLWLDAIVIPSIYKVVDSSNILEQYPASSHIADLDSMAVSALKAVFERNYRDEVLELIYWTEKEVPTSILPFGHPNVFSLQRPGSDFAPSYARHPPNLVGLGQDDSQDNEAQPRITFPPTEDRVHHHVNPFNIIGIRTPASHKPYTIEQYGFMARDHMLRRQMEPKCGPELRHARILPQKQQDLNYAK